MKTRKCSACKEVKTSDCFYSKSGYCKICTREYGKRNSLKHILNIPNVTDYDKKQYNVNKAIVEKYLKKK